MIPLLKIAMLSFYLPSENKIGSGYQAHYMANALARRGHAVTMFAPVPKPHDALYHHTLVPVGNKLRILRFARNLRRIDFSPFDVLHAHGEDYLLYTRKHPIHVRTMHGSCLAEALHVPRLKEKLRMLMIGCTECAAFLAADATVGVSQNTCRSYPFIKRTILNGVDTSAFYPAPQKEIDPTILFVGTYQNRKRGKLLMEAFAKTIRPAIPAAKLWMVCNDAPAAPGVEVLGKLSTPDLADRYRRAWIFCLPSSYEGFGVPYIEAMASGTPVVATPNPGAKEVLANGKFGVLTQPDQLGHTLLTLLQSPEDRQRLTTLSLQRAQNFAWPTIAAQYESLYAQLMPTKTEPSTNVHESTQILPRRSPAPAAAAAPHE
jgi:glycosyltransferase involved in cell wall biosynthesis